MASRHRTLLEPGHEAEWARLNAEKRAFLTPPRETPVGELLRRGQQLSAQAGKLLRAIDGADEQARS
jgi:mannose/cellobiose epimerase-like protein (N-acyl-D-glucosamine 2-epimerase family)